MLHRFAHPWDYGAGVLLVREAGGYISDLDGRPYTKASFSVLAAATPTLHAGLVDLLPASRAGPS
jgi:myo-inositol-1(or 4)-monophosphatase